MCYTNKRKKCPDWGEKIHDVCAVEDREAGLSEMGVCPDCWGARKPTSEVTLPTGRTRRSSEISSLASLLLELARENRHLVAKPLKHKVATKERNRLHTDKRVLLLRAGLNLRWKSESMRSAKVAPGKVDLDNALVYE
jgi:hypothetical protein